MMNDEVKTHETGEAAGPPPPLRALPFLVLPGLVALAVTALFATAWLASGPGRSPAEWLEAIRTGEGAARRHAALGLARSLAGDETPRDPALAKAVLELFETVDPGETEVREALAAALGLLRDPRACGALVRIAREEGPIDLRTTCLDALGAIRDPSALPGLVELAGHPDGVIRKFAVFNLGAVSANAVDPGAVAVLRRALKDERADVGWNAAVALAVFLGDDAGVDTLGRMLDRDHLEAVIGNDPNAEALVRHALVTACTAAAGLGNRVLVPALERLAEGEPDGQVRHAARTAALRLSGAGG
jgi:HEAT repeat protein